jgi:carboxymethylenebutenolidase
MALQIDYFLSLNSPWTHLGAARLEAMAARHGATIRIFPVDFGAIFQATGGLPLSQRSPQRRAYRLWELRRWSAHLGVPIRLEPRFFPMREPLPAHCVVALRETQGHAAAIRLAHRVLKALWEEDKDPGEEATLAALIAETGEDAPALLRLAADPRWAARRAADTAAAIARGVFGAPTYIVGDEPFWGQDRLDFLERRLARGD